MNAATTDQVAAQLVALGYIPPGDVIEGMPWWKDGVGVTLGVALLVLGLVIFVFRRRRLGRLTRKVDRH